MSMIFFFLKNLSNIFQIPHLIIELSILNQIMELNMNIMYILTKNFINFLESNGIHFIHSIPGEPQHNGHT